MTWNEPASFLIGLLLVMTIGALLPIKIENREDYVVLTIGATVAGAILGLRSLVLIWVGVVLALPFMVLWSMLPRNRERLGAQGAARSLVWITCTAFALTVAWELANLVYTGIFDREYPIKVYSAEDFAVAGTVVAVWGVGLLAVRVVMVRLLEGSFISFGLDPFDSVLVPYLLPIMGGFPLVTASVALYRPEDAWPSLLILWWCFPLYAATAFDLHRRRLAQDLRRDVLAQQRLAAIGEVSARIVHQSRHQVGLMGFSIHRLRALMGTTDPAELEAAEAELDALVSAKDRLSEMLASELLHERQDEPVDESPEHAATLADVVEDVQVQLLAEAAASGIRLRADVDAVAGERPVAAQLHDVLFNLVDNAIDAAASQVTISARQLNGGPEIRVSDDGPGLGELDTSKVFEPFYTTKSDGTGMGLAIADALVGDLGGELRYERFSGTTAFVITLHS